MDGASSLRPSSVGVFIPSLDGVFDLSRVRSALGAVGGIIDRALGAVGGPLEG